MSARRMPLEVAGRMVVTVAAGMLLAFIAPLVDGVDVDCGGRNVTVSESFNFSISCAMSSPWWVFVVGCNDTSVPVNVWLHGSPRQVIVSDNMTSNREGLHRTLNGCSINITYVADTAVPVAGTAGASQAHVYTYVTSSMLRSLNVTLLGVLHMEGSFVGIAGNSSGSIGLVSVSAPASSSIVCRPSAPLVVVCSATKGSSMLTLADGCPQIDHVVVILNGTNVSSAMREVTSIESGAIFGLVTLDDSTGVATIPTPLLHDIVVDNIPLVVVEALVFLLSLSPVTGLIALAYPNFSGSISISKCVAIDHQQSFVSPFLLQLTNPSGGVIILDGVTSTMYLLSISNTQVSSSSLGLVRVRFHQCTFTPAYQYALSLYLGPIWRGAPVGTYLVDVLVSETTFALSSEGSICFGFNSGATTSVMVPLLIVLTSCTFEVNTTSPQILSALGRVTLSSSTIRFNSVTIRQRLQPSQLTFSPSGAANSLVSLQSTVNTTITFLMTNMTMVQAANVTAVTPALLLSTVGPSRALVVSLAGVALTFVPNLTFTSRDVRLLNISVNMSDTTILLELREATFTGITSILTPPQPILIAPETRLNMSVTADCATRWCIDNHCAMITSNNLLGVPQIASWQHVANCVPTATGSMSAPTHTPIVSRATHTISGGTSMTISKKGWTASPSACSLAAPTATQSSKSVSSTHAPSHSATLIVPLGLIPAAPPEAPGAVQAVTVAVIAALGGALISSSVAGVLQRGTVALRFSNCGAYGGNPANATDVRGRAQSNSKQMGIAESPTRLSFGDERGAVYRGAALGNIALLAGAAALSVMAAASVAHWRERRRSPRHRKVLIQGSPYGGALATMQLPGRACLAYCVLLQPTVTASVGLLLLGPPAGDVALAVIALAVLVGVAAWLGWVVHRGCNRLVSASPVPAAGGILGYATGWRVEWVPNKECRLRDGRSGEVPRHSWLLDDSVVGAEQFVQQFSTFFGRVSGGTWRELFFVSGFLWSAITGAVGALDPFNSSDCRAAQLTLLAVAVVSTIATVVVRPYAAPVDRDINVTLELLSVVLAVLALTDTAGGDTVAYVQLGVSVAASTLRLAIRMRQWCAGGRQPPTTAKADIESDSSAAYLTIEALRLEDGAVSSRGSPKDLSSFFTSSMHNNTSGAFAVPFQLASLRRPSPSQDHQLSSSSSVDFTRALRLQTIIDGQHDSLVASFASTASVYSELNLSGDHEARLSVQQHHLARLVAAAATTGERP